MPLGPHGAGPLADGILACGDVEVAHGGECAPRPASWLGGWCQEPRPKAGRSTQPCGGDGTIPTMSMSRMLIDDLPDLKRTVKGALILPAPGVVSSADLVAMPEDNWRTLRNRISDGHNGDPHGLKAICMFPGCGGSVYVSEKPKGSRRYPYFAHRQGEGLECPWHPGSKLTLDEARAAQYKGNQVSAAHEFLCRELARLVKLDPRLQAVESIGPTLPGRMVRAAATLMSASAGRASQSAS